MKQLRDHLWRHRRFYLSALLGIFSWVVTTSLTPPLRLAIAGDTFFAANLVLMTALAMRVTPDQLRNWASIEDEGIIIIVLITMVVISFSLISIFSVLNQSHRPNAVLLILSIASAPLGWFMLHTVAAFRYAHVYYAERLSESFSRSEVGGLKFPGTEEPAAWDFLYYSFVLGMTAQVSDVQVLTTSMRKLALAHGIVSFFFNTVLIALAVNAAVVLAQSSG
jgi:uncharacterized membrane protein